MTPLQTILTETTCGATCWTAKEDVCRCSCGGKNHGCSLTPDGVKPDRTAKIDGFRYKLLAVGPRYNHSSVGSNNTGLSTQAREINRAEPKKVIGSYTYSYRDTEKGAPARIKSATKSQIASWPELAAYRESTWQNHPYLLWVKIEKEIVTAIVPPMSEDRIASLAQQVKQ
jgi:hypothetical protein